MHNLSISAVNCLSNFLPILEKKINARVLQKDGNYCGPFEAPGQWVVVSLGPCNIKDSVKRAINGKFSDDILKRLLNYLSNNVPLVSRCRRNYCASLRKSFGPSQSNSNQRYRNYPTRCARKPI